jgi:hypothetical protein
MYVSVLKKEGSGLPWRHETNKIHDTALQRKNRDSPQRHLLENPRNHDSGVSKGVEGSPSIPLTNPTV